MEFPGANFVAANWMSCGHEVDIEVGHVDQELLVGVVYGKLWPVFMVS